MKNKKNGFEILIISGLSGSGKTAALQLMEDIGFFCVDNLPATMIADFLHNIRTHSCTPSDPINKVAIVIDARSHSFLHNFEGNIKKIKDKYKTRILFFEASPRVLQIRYSESRRKHPISPKGTVGKGIAQEKKILMPIRKMADKIIDTSDLNVHELKQLLRAYFHLITPAKEMNISLISFGYKHGIPIQADLMFDVRFLPNPFFIRTLKSKTGLEPKVADFVLNQKATQKFLEMLENFLLFLISEYEKEGKSYLTIAIGCTGGKHRSVVIVESLAREFKKIHIQVSLTHRDVKRP